MAGRVPGAGAPLPRRSKGLTRSGRLRLSRVGPGARGPLNERISRSEGSPAIELEDECQPTFSPFISASALFVESRSCRSSGGLWRPDAVVKLGEDGKSL